MDERVVRSTLHTVQKRKQSQGVINDLDNVDFVPSNVNSSHQEALLYVFEDNEAVIKMIIKGRSPTMRHVSRTHRVALDWLFDRIILDPKIQIKYIDTKKQLADTLTKGNFTREKWNHLLCWFNISHFSSSNCSEVMSKRTQKDSGEERVTTKSKPMMNLSRDTVWGVRTCLPRLHRKAAGKPKLKVRKNLSSLNEQQPRTGRLVMGASSSEYSEWNIDDKWSSQEWNSGETFGARTGRPVGGQPFTQHTDKFVIDDDDVDSESNLLLKSRSFLNRVNDRLRKMLDQSSQDATQDSNQHSIIWECLCLRHYKHLYSCERITQKT